MKSLDAINQEFDEPPRIDTTFPKYIFPSSHLACTLSSMFKVCEWDRGGRMEMGGGGGGRERERGREGGREGEGCR